MLTEHEAWKSILDDLQNKFNSDRGCWTCGHSHRSNHGLCDAVERLLDAKQITEKTVAFMRAKLGEMGFRSTGEYWWPTNELGRQTRIKKVKQFVATTVPSPAKKLSERQAWVYLAQLFENADEWVYLPQRRLDPTTMGICGTIGWLQHVNFISYEMYQRLRKTLFKNKPKGAGPKYCYWWHLDAPGFARRAKLCRDIVKTLEPKEDHGKPKEAKVKRTPSLVTSRR